MIIVSVRFNRFGVRVLKQGKRLIAASEISVFVGCNITDGCFFTSAQASAPTILFLIENLPLCYSSAFLEL